MWIPVFSEDARQVGADVAFTCRLLDRVIRCRVTAETLGALAGAGDAEPLALYRAHRERLEDKVRHKIRNGQYDSDGGITIKPGDLDSRGGDLLKPRAGRR